MLIPSIDLRGGRVVQLVQGRRLAFADQDVDAWVARFSAYPLVQLIDLDAAIGTGDNRAIVARICSMLPCRVGGGVRTPERAKELVEAGALDVIVGSALFPDGRPDVSAAERFSAGIGTERLVGAVDSLKGHVVIKGWRASVPVTAEEAVRVLSPSCGAFLYTRVDGEGMLGGIDLDAVRRVRAATTRRIAAAGGISTWEEIDALDREGIDAVVGMAIYTGKLAPR